MGRRGGVRREMPRTRVHPRYGTDHIENAARITNIHFVIYAREDASYTNAPELQVGIRAERWAGSLLYVCAHLLAVLHMRAEYLIPPPRLRPPPPRRMEDPFLLNNVDDSSGIIIVSRAQRGFIRTYNCVGTAVSRSTKNLGHVSA